MKIRETKFQDNHKDTLVQNGMNIEKAHKHAKVFSRYMSGQINADDQGRLMPQLD